MLVSSIHDQFSSGTRSVGHNDSTITTSLPKVHKKTRKDRAFIPYVPCCNFCHSRWLPTRIILGVPTQSIRVYPGPSYTVDGTKADERAHLVYKPIRVSNDACGDTLMAFENLDEREPLSLSQIWDWNTALPV